jgi:hypothetical protein
VAAASKGEEVIGTRRLSSGAALLVVIAVALTCAACSGGTTASGKLTTAQTRRELVGLFKFAPGTVVGGQVTGSWFRMLQPGGNEKSGPYMRNADSPADGGLATLLQPGTAGGLRTGGYQSQPSPAFASDGNSLADAIMTPTKFFGVKFSISTNRIDLQTKTEVAPPMVWLQDGKLTADLSAWAASWNNQNFNQGAPKPVSSTGAKAPGQQQVEKVWDWVSDEWLESSPKPTVNGSDATGTYNAATRTFVLDWTSLIVGGPFNGFTGFWHLQGVYVPSGSAPINS